MKRIYILTQIVIAFAITAHAQFTQVDPKVPVTAPITRTTIGIVISTNDAETAWNAFRLANYALNQGDTVSVFLLGKGVEAPEIKDKEFDVKDQMNSFSENGGKIMACGTCLRSRKTEGSKLCPVSAMSDLYEMIKTNEKVLTF